MTQAPAMDRHGTPRSHASAQTYDPFADSFGPVGHAPHFEVERLPGTAPGEPARFRKTVKAGVGEDLLPMIHRENLLLMDMASRRLPHAAQSLAFTRDSSESPFVVTTLDAGPSLNLWLRHAFVPHAQPAAAPRSLLSPTVFLVLLRQVLVALRSFHEAGFIHGDIHAGNVCLPFERHPTDARALRPRYEQLRLIDFGHTLSNRLHFPEPLRLDPDAPESLRRVSPAFRAALRHDAVQQRAQQVLALDFRLDLFALGAMAGQFLGTVDWTQEPHAVPLQPRLAAVVDALRAQDCDSHPPEPGLHDRLLAPIDALLAELPPPTGEWLIPIARGGDAAPELARETPLVTALVTTGAAAGRHPHPGPLPRAGEGESKAVPASRVPMSLVMLLGVAVIGAASWAWYAGLLPGVPGLRGADPRAAGTSAARARAPAPPPATVPEVPDPPERQAVFYIVDQDLNQMIQSAAAGEWREVEAGARNVASRMQTMPSGQPSTLLLAGERAIERGDYTQAAAALRKAARDTPEDWAVWSAYGYALLRLGDVTGARAALGRALRLRPQDASAWAHLAEVLALQGRQDAAAATLRLAVYFSRQRPRTLAHLRSTDGSLMAPELQAIVRAQDRSLDRIPERSP